MGIIRRIGTFFSSLEKRSNLATPEKWLVDWFSGGGSESLAGVHVTSATAMQYVAVYACIDILSRTVGSLPLYLYRRLPEGGKELARSHPLFRLMRRQPNPEMTAMRYRSTLQGHLASWGNAYSYIDWGGDGYPAALWPLRPDRIQPRRKNGVLEYTYYPIQGEDRSGESFVIPGGNILHIPGFGFDGIIGYSPISLAREAIGLGMATEEFGARYFGTGTHPGMIVEHPGKLSPEGHVNLKNALSDTYSGLGKSHRLMLLQEGMKANKIVINPQDSQFLETRKFQVTEIARLFHIPPHMIADVEKTTSWGTGIEEQNIAFITITMRPWFVLWEEELGRTLLMEREKDEYFFEFDMSQLLRGDTLKQMQAWVLGKRNGIFNADEIRGWANLNPIPDGLGSAYIVEKNMTTLAELEAGGDEGTISDGNNT
ncbi:MAG: phage portal protein [Anaerovoracaceae bacterium]